MDKETARSFLLLVNDRQFMSLLNDYSTYRINYLRGLLDGTSLDLEQIRIIQGRIDELKRFKTLRDEVIRAAGD